MAFDWNEASVYNLTSLWREGVPFSLIGKQIGVSRNSAIGKAHRLGLKRGPQQPAKAQLASNRRQRKTFNPFAPTTAPRKVNINHAARAAKSASKEARAVAKTTPYEGALDVAFLDLKPHHCRYITSGERAEALYCGAPRVAEKAWCPHHYALCYQPSRGALGRPRG